MTRVSDSAESPPQEQAPWWRRLRGWLATVAGGIAVGVGVWLITRSDTAVLTVQSPAAVLMSRREYIRDQHGQVGDLNERVLRQPGVKLIANVEVRGLDGAVLRASCWLHDVAGHRDLEHEELRLHLTKAPYLDPPCWRPLTAGRIYQGFIEVHSQRAGQQTSPPVRVIWEADR